MLQSSSGPPVQCAGPLAFILLLDGHRIQDIQAAQGNIPQACLRSPVPLQEWILFVARQALTARPKAPQADSFAQGNRQSMVPPPFAPLPVPPLDRPIFSAKVIDILLELPYNNSNYIRRILAIFLKEELQWLYAQSVAWKFLKTSCMKIMAYLFVMTAN